MNIHYKLVRAARFAAITSLLIAANRSSGEYYAVIHLDSGCYDEIAYGTSGTEQVASGLDLELGWRGVIVRRALLWDTVGVPRIVKLHPPGYYASEAYGVRGTQQVGWGQSQANISRSALLWQGSAETYVSLHPSGSAQSMAYATNGTRQVGNAEFYDTQTSSFISHAILWNGSAADYVDLTPNEFHDAVAKGIDGNQQVGHGTTGGSAHALLWSGSAGSYVDLHPVGMSGSYAVGIRGTQQVGHGSVAGGANHALLWTGSAASCVDLNPDGFIHSFAKGTNGKLQVGIGIAADGIQHALLWKGTANGCLDLHQFLPSWLTTSAAFGIDESGNIVGSAGDGVHAYAILWRPAAEMPRLMLVNPALVGNNFTFSLHSVAGQTYTIEYTEDLIPTNWQFHQTVTGDGFVMPCIVAMPNPKQCFFRVRTP